MAEENPHRKDVAQRSTCIENKCGREFIITVGELEFYSSKFDELTGLPFELPKRCPLCRRKNREKYGNKQED